MKPTHRFGLFSIFVSMSTPLAAQSLWNGTSNANWSNAANWSPGIPAEGGDIIISDTTANGLTLDDGSHAVGSITVGTTGTRTSGFTLNSTTANTLTIAGGVVADGNFTGGIGARIRGNSVISAEQTWQVGGQPGSHAADRGIAFNEVASSGVAGSVALNANLNKLGTGQLTMGAVNVTGSGDINVNDGSLKLNAGGSLPLTVGGTGKIAVNNTAMLILSQNSGSFDVSRPIQFNLGASLMTGSGSNGKTGDFTIASDMEWNGTHIITNNNDNNNAGDVRFIFTGVMSGAGTITKSGPRSLTLAGTSSNTISTDITVTEGELRLDKTGATAVAGNILVTGGSLRKLRPNQIADTSTVTVTGGGINFNSDAPDTIAALNISSGAISSVSGFNVTGATTITAGLHQLNSGQTFTTNSLSLSNNAAIQLVGAAVFPAFSTVNIGAGGLTMNTGRLLYGNPGNDSTTQVNLAGDVVSTGTSLFSAANYDGERILDLQAGSRSFAVNDGTLDIRTTVQNGTLVKSGGGTLILSQPGSTADYSFTEGSVQISTQADAGNVSLSGGSLLMDIGGDTPAKITTSGDFTYTGGSIEISAVNGVVTPGTLELVRYGGTLTGTPVVNIPPQLAASRMNPVVNYGTGTDSAITLNATASPLSLIWHGATAGGLWDNNTTANFNSGTETFYPLDSVTFDDSGANASIVLNSAVSPSDVVFNHGDTVDTYTLSGTGSISGPTKLTKNGIGTTVLLTDNDYTGATEVFGGVLQVGNGGLTGSIGTGAAQVEFGGILEFSRDGSAIVGNLFTGSGTILNSGPGTVALTANSNGFTGEVSITGGRFQFGDGGADGSLGLAQVNIGSGATFAVKRSGAPTIGNYLFGDGAVTISGGNPILTNFNAHTGGTTVTDDGTLRMPGDWVLGLEPVNLVTNAIRLNLGGLKNQDSDTVTHFNRGVTVTGEAYFTAGWSKTLTVAGPITGTANVFINYDSGRVIFSNPTSNWNGILTLGADKPGFTGTTGGNLEITTITNGGVAGPLGMASADPANLVFNGGRLIYAGETASSNRGFTLQGAGSINVTTATLTMSGQVTGPGSLTKVGDGILVLSGANNFVGNVIADDGVLSLTSTDSLGDPAKTVIAAGDAGANRIPEIQLSGGISPVIADLDTSGAGVDGLSGVIHNVSGDNTLTVTNDVTMRTGVGATTLYSSAGTFTLNTPLVTANATNRQLILAGPGNGVINGAIANGTTAALPVVKSGSGTWTLNGAHTYTGATTVNEGILSLGQAALANTSTVSIADGAVLNLNFTGIDEVAVLTLDGNPMAAGIYGATHPDFGHFFSGTGSIRVGPGDDGYDNWAATHPFTVGVNDGPTDDPDGDGINNLLEYLLGGIPVGAGASDTSILPTQVLNASSLVLTFERSDMSEADVTLKVQWSDNMTTWNDFVTIGAGDNLPAVDITEDSPTADLDTVVVTIPRNITPGGKLFARLHAVK